MLNIIYSVIAGLIQGLTEFLPVSSSGHLVFFHDLTGFDASASMPFDVILHLGTLAALVIFFWQDLWRYFLAFCQSLIKWDLKNNKDQLLAWLILIATVPAAIAGLLFEKKLENIFRHSLQVAVVMVIFGVILYVADRYLMGENGIERLTPGNSLIIGLAQMLALIPGVSRSGITIIAGMEQKLKRKDAARFSFLVSVPIIFGAGLKEMADIFTKHALGGVSLTSLFIAFLVSAVTGFFCIKYFLKYLESHSLKIFAYYRIILGLLIIIYLLAIK